MTGYSRSSLVRAARDQGYGEVSERLVTDWAANGLLDRPQRTGRGKGRGSGAFYEWPEEQLALFLSLLEHRAQVKRQAGLCVIPVGIWLYWGDQWVPLRQVKVALRTWWDGAGGTGLWRRASDNARTVVNAFAPRRSPADVKKQLRDELTQAIYGATFDVERIGPLVERLLEVGPGQGRWGPLQNTPEEVVDGMRAMIVAISRYDELSDGYFIECRARHRNMTIGYLRDYPRWSSHPVYGSWFEAPDLQFLMNRACQILMMELGMRLITEDKGVALPPITLEPWSGPPPEMLRMSPGSS